MRLRAMALLLAVPLVNIALPATTANATAIYTFVGNNFTSFNDDPAISGTYTASMRVAGYFEVAVPLVALLPFTNITASLLSYSFSDGRSTLTEGNSSATISVMTGGLGEIIGWNISASAGLPVASVGALGFSVSTASNQLDVASVHGCTGLPCATFRAVESASAPTGRRENWSFSVPEPHVALLVASGLLGLWRQRRRVT